MSLKNESEHEQLDEMYRRGLVSASEYAERKGKLLREPDPNYLGDKKVEEPGFSIYGLIFGIMAFLRIVMYFMK